MDRGLKIQLFNLILWVFLSGMSTVSWADPAQSRPGTPYKYVDRNGHTSFTDKPPHDGYIKLVKTWKGWQTPKPSGDLQSKVQKVQSLVSETAKKYDLPRWLVQAVIHAESFYNPHAVSHAGAVGLMQLMPATARRYGVRDRHNAEQNVEGGTRYLRDLLDMFDDNTELALAAYNAGENAVKKYGYQIPPYKETQNYVRRVKTLSARYRSASQLESTPSVASRQ